tara:strand:- start:10677 stop:12602 length:1926 start_codon:yes stop_codon:yes gene_type:complete
MIPLYGRYTIGSSNDTNLIPINEWDINVNEVAESCLIGPQGELITLIQNFNSNHAYYMDENDAPIGATKKFFWKRGSYDTIKNVYNKKCLQFSMKNNGIGIMKRRIDNNQWQARRFWSTLTEIENKMLEFRRQGLSWMDNTSIVDSYVQEMRETLANSLANNPYPNIELEIYVDTSRLNAMEHKIVILGRIKDVNIKVKHGGEIIGVVPTDDILLLHELKLWHHINSHCIAEDPHSVILGNSSRYNIMSYGKLETDMKLNHPYISRRAAYPREDHEFWKSICMGDHDSPWRTAINNLNIDVMLHYMNIWANNYDIPSTNPLNKIYTCFYGLPNSVDQKVLNLSMDNSSVEDRINNCNFPNIYLNNLHQITVGSLNPQNDNGEEYTGGGYTRNYKSINPKVGDYYTDEYGYQLENNCLDCQYVQACKKAILPDQFNVKGALSWNSSEYHDSSINDDEDNKYYMKQQILMHVVANNIYYYGAHSVILTSEYHNQLCLMSLSEDIKDMKEKGDTNHTKSNLLYFYRKAEYKLRNIPVEYLIEYIVESSDPEIENNYEKVRDRYMLTMYGYAWDDCSSDEREFFHEDMDGCSVQEILLEAIMLEAQYAHSERKIVKKAVSVPEEALTPEERVIRWASQRGGALNL